MFSTSDLHAFAASSLNGPTLLDAWENCAGTRHVQVDAQAISKRPGPRKILLKHKLERKSLKTIHNALWFLSSYDTRQKST